MHWGQDGEQPNAELFVREVTAFLRAQRDGRPAVLWPQYDHPAVESPEFDGQLTSLAADLAACLGRPVQAHPAGPPGPPSDGPRTTVAEGLLMQGLGASGVTVTSPAGPGGTTPRRQRIRLRAGEMLYVPCGTTYTVDRQADSQYGVLTVAPDGPAD
jgi:hypothetical protein